MDPGAWAAYGQHYQRLGAGGVNPSASALAQTGQLNDLSLSASLPRQDSIGGYGSAGPPALLLSHHGLNVSQGGHHSDAAAAASFVNSASLLGPGYDQMISSFQSSTKGHLPLNVSHGAGLYKAMTVAKDPEMGDLRGGFVRRGIPASAMASDPNMGMGSSAPGLFNPQTSAAHSWRHSNMVPTATSSPFGVLPHEAVISRSSVTDSVDKLHSQDHRSKSSRMMMDTRCYMDQADLVSAAAAHGYRNALSQGRSATIVDPNTGSRGSLMMQQSEHLGPSSDTLGLSGIKSSEYALYSNSNVNAARGLLAQNYIPQPHFPPPPQDLQSDKRDLYDLSLLSAEKVEAYGGGGGGSSSKSHFDVLSNSQSLSGNGSVSSSSLHGVSTTQNQRGSQQRTSQGSSSGPQAAHSRQMCTTQSQSRSTTHSVTYVNYGSTATAPTYSQSYHQASPLPSPSHSIHSPAHYSPASAVDFSNTLASHGGPPTPVSTPHYPHSSSVLSHGDSPGVIYSSVITRANVPVSSSGTYAVSSMTPPHKPMSSKHLSSSNESKIATPTPPPLQPHTPQPSLHRSYDSVPVMGASSSGLSEENCITDMVGSNHNIPTNLSRMSSAPNRVQTVGESGATSSLNQMDHGLINSPHSSLVVGRGIGSAADACASPKTMSMENVFNPQQMTLQDLAEMTSSNDKMDLEAAGVGLLPSQQSKDGSHGDSHLMDLSQPPQHISGNMLHNMVGGQVPSPNMKPAKKRIRRTKKKQLAEEAAAAAVMQQSGLVATNGTVPHHLQMPMLRPGVGVSPSSHVMNVPQSPVCPPPEQLYSPPPTHVAPIPAHMPPTPAHMSPVSTHVPLSHIPSSCVESYSPGTASLNYHSQLAGDSHRQFCSDRLPRLPAPSTVNNAEPRGTEQSLPTINDHSASDRRSMNETCGQPDRSMIINNVQRPTSHQLSVPPPPVANDISSTPSPLSSFDAVSFDPVSIMSHDDPKLPCVLPSMDQKPPETEFQTCVVKPERKGPRIEDDLGFLAELPPVCNVNSDLKKNRTASGTSSASGASSGGNFIDSFLKFLNNSESASNEGTELPSGSSSQSKSSARGRGSKLRETFTSPPQGKNVELNPMTGLFTCTEKSRGGGGGGANGGNSSGGVSCVGRGRGGSPVLSSAKSPIQQIGQKPKFSLKCEAGTSFVSKPGATVSGSDAFTFSSEDDDEALGSKGFTDSVNMALKSLTDVAGSGTTPSSKSSLDHVGDGVDQFTFTAEELPSFASGPQFFSTFSKPSLRQGDFKCFLKPAKNQKTTKKDHGSNANDSSPKSPRQQVSLVRSVVSSAPNFQSVVGGFTTTDHKGTEKTKEKSQKKRTHGVEGKKTAGDLEDTSDSSEMELSLKRGRCFDSCADSSWGQVHKDGTNIMGLPGSGVGGCGQQSVSLRGRRRGDRDICNLPTLSGPYMEKNSISVESEMTEKSCKQIDDLKHQRKSFCRGRPKLNDKPKVAFDNRLENTAGFQSGDFIILSSDKSQANAPIWRIDSHSLLQKFEPFKDGNKTLYKGLASYSRFSLGSKALYEPIAVRIVKSGQNCVIVEYLKDSVGSGTKGNMCRSNSERDETAQKENFEVYLQTLISQALDPNFISEIVKENDEYFLTHVHAIDDIIRKKKAQLSKSIQWDSTLKEHVESFPLLMVRPYSSEDGQGLKCQICAKVFVFLRRISFEGPLYNYTTLCLSKEPFGRQQNKKEFLLCTNCTDVIQAYSHIHHQKYNLFTMCANKVNGIKSSDPSQESHVILEHCLQDSTWINKLFGKIKSIWTTCSVLCR